MSSASQLPARRGIPAQERTGCTCHPRQKTGLGCRAWRFLAAGVEQRREPHPCSHRRPGRRFGAHVDLLGTSRLIGRCAASPASGHGPLQRCDSAPTVIRTPGASATITSDEDITYTLTGEELDDEACLKSSSRTAGTVSGCRCCSPWSAAVGRAGHHEGDLPTHTPYATRGRS